MCGILSYYNKNGISKQNVLECLNSLQRIKHRGPDGEGIVLINTSTGESKIFKTEGTPPEINSDYAHISEIDDLKYDLLLGHRRLSIFDTSSAGHQPMKSTNTNSWIVFNGEIYNFFEIREELKTLGYSFLTGTDTEVILIAYQEWGEACLSRFNGMWSFVLWDNNKKVVFVSNDRFGVKPLYYFKNNEELIFASEIKQYLPFKSLKISYNVSNFNVFLDSGMLDYDDSTFYNEIHRFKCANYISATYSNLFQEEKLFFKLYYSLKTDRQKISCKDALEEYKKIFRSAVEIRLRSDVPFGVTVSGGLDSSSIVYQVDNLLNNKSPIQSFSAIFPNMDGDESEFIDFIGKDLNLIKNTVNPLRDFNMDDFLEHQYHQDYPVQSTSYYAEWCVAKSANKNGVKILLNGQGADEVFAGYHHHFYKYCKSLILSGKILKYLTVANDYAELKGWKVQQIHNAVIADVKLAVKLKLGLKGMDNAIQGHWNNAKNLTEILKLDLCKTSIPTYLRSDDRDGMAYGIESRHPFMDYRLIDFGFSLPDEYKIKNGWQKWIIRESMDEVPNKIRWRTDKKGYTTPQELWVEKYLNEFQKDLQILTNYSIDPQFTFRHYSLSLWLKDNELS